MALQDPFRNVMYAVQLTTYELLIAGFQRSLVKSLAGFPGVFDRPLVSYHKTSAETSPTYSPVLDEIIRKSSGLCFSLNIPPCLFL